MPQPNFMHVMYNFIFLGYLLATLAYLSLVFVQNEGMAKFGKGMIFLTLALQTVFIALRVVADHDYVHFWYAPVANIFEEATALAWGLALLYLITETVTGFRALGAFITPLLASLVAWCAFGSGAMEQSLEQPPPALQSYWIDIHVPTHVIAYAAFTIAFGMSIAYLLKRGSERKLGGNGRAGAGVASAVSTPPRGGVAVAERLAANQAAKAAPTGFLSMVPASDLLDRMTYKMVIVGFGFMTALIMLGATWAEVSWGTYWGWDPKETSALITWMVYAVYIHGRILLGWGTKKKELCAWLCVAGFAALMFTYLGVGFLLPGLHSYLKG